MRRFSFILAAGALFATTASGFAQQTEPVAPIVPESGDATEVNSVFVFNRVCYGQVPNLEGIRRMAGQLAWTPVEGADLDGFKPEGTVDTIEAWDAPIGQRVFRVAVTQGPLNEQLKGTFPDFASGSSTSCTLVLDGQDPADSFIAQLTALAGKEPASRDVADGGQLTTTWAGGNADVKVFLVGKTGVESTGSLINVVVLTK
jgi:hypothetical protein